MNRSFVSVVMPTYNGAKFIEKSIKSILNQTYTNFEFVIVDDGSTDNTSEIIKSFEDQRIGFIYQDNQGPARAYNTGFKSAKGDYIFIQDHDDFSFPERLKKQLEFIKNYQLDICGANYIIFDEKNGFEERKSLPIKDGEIKKELIYKPWTLFNPTLCIKKSVFNKLGYYDESFLAGYDYEFIIRAAEIFRCGNVPEYLYRWTLNRESHGSAQRIYGNKVFRNISLQKLESDKLSLSKSENYFYRGMINYYSDSLLKASKWFFLSILSGYIRFRVFLYLLLTTIFSPVVYGLRRKRFFSHPVVVRLKRIVSDFH